jgi:spermidine synthase
MGKNFKATLAAMFFLSGFCSLVYQIVWIRMAYTHFGVILPVLSVSISVFMLGLGLGSYFGGKYIDVLSAKTKIKSAVFYGFAEIIIGSGAVLMPVLFAAGQKLLLMTGQTNSVSYMLLSALFLGAAMLPWCIAMGTTFPFIMSFIKQTDFFENSSFSFLYTANVLGSVFGVLFTVIYAIELFGLTGTLHITALFNLLIALTAFYCVKKFAAPLSSGQKQAAPQSKSPVFGKSLLNPSFLKFTLFITGFVSLGLEVAWTRAFSPALGTMVYAFSFLLAAYLLSTYLGTVLYRRNIAKGKNISFGFLLSALAVTSFFPVIINDPNLLGQGMVNTVNGYKIYKYLLQISATIVPVCMVLGYLTPSIIDYYSGGDAKKAGESYAINVLGCILGPLAVSYLMLPFISAKAVMIVMSALYIVLFLLFIKNVSKTAACISIPVLSVFLLVSSLYTTTYELPYRNFNNVFTYRDTTATVSALRYKRSDGFLDASLLVNGYGMTNLTNITKVMAHLPLAFCDNPKTALAICFGMGTTYRSLLSWGDVETTAVELTPGVVKAFPVFYDDAAEVLKNPKGEIIIDDGRRYLMRTDKKFDVITVDPPPPLETSGSSLLYSREFYKFVKMRLTEGGLLQHWVPISDDYTKISTMRAILKTITEEFPYVKCRISIEGWGVHITASMRPIGDFSAQELAAKLPAKANDDLLEWIGKGVDAREVFSILLKREVSADELLKGWTKEEYISDSHPYNEYFLLRDM